MKCLNNKCRNRNLERKNTFFAINLDIFHQDASILESAINNNILKSTQCKFCSAKKVHEYSIGDQIFIETVGSTEICISNLPLDINVNNKHRILRWVIVFVKPLSDNCMGHFYTLCRRLYGTWEKYDDLLHKVINFNKGEFILPHCIVYSV